MKLFFNISEFITRKDLPVPVEAQDKILKDHIWPLNQVRSHIGTAVRVTSGYRPVSHEKERGRDGTSEHVFAGKGACDLTVIRPRLEDFAQSLIRMTSYTRICFYPGSVFFHLDYKFPERGNRRFVGPAWNQVSDQEFIAEIRNVMNR